MCSNSESSSDFYCDQDCRDYALKAYYTSYDEILLVQGDNSMYVDPDNFPTLFLEGLTCDVDECLITSTQNNDGSIDSSYEAQSEFVEFW